MRGERLNQLLGVVLCAVFVAMSAGSVWSAERIIYVDAAATGADDGSSWVDAYHDLQDALAEANGTPPAVIRVAQGTYRPGPPMGETSPSWNATFQLHNHVTLEGGYAGVLAAEPNDRDVECYPTVLSGDLAGNDSPDEDWRSPARQDNCRRIVTASGTDATAVIDGFTITGAAEYGMWMQPGSPSVFRCRFVENAITGIYAWDCNSAVVQCAFERNGRLVSWGGFWVADSDLTLTDCAFVGNQGGGLNSSGTLDMRRCSFVAHRALSTAGIDHVGDLMARKCRFASNKGTAVHGAGRTTLTDCEFTGNSCRYAGAVEAHGSLILEGCEFVGNSGSGMSGGPWRSMAIC
ncbi:MAG: right-handed parallel beta-helix repeat-containing protein [Planctomycetota bacterium]|nr:right-handed parallel beta-helix repeat-containing protein [Planctomycetota bacterium]